MKTVKTPKGIELPLMNLKGKDYLQVMYRIQWFREVNPDWSIETEMVKLDERGAIFKASVKDPDGRVISTGHKEETFAAFDDAVGKSETGAIGRALALCGFGTQFAEELDEGERIVDSPVGRAHNPVHQAPPKGPQDPAGYVVSFGKFKDKRVGDIPDGDLVKYINQLRHMAKEDGKPLGGKAAEFVSVAESWLKTNEDVPV